MHRQLEEWATTFEPLERSEELKIIKETTNDTDLLEIMLRHNARMILKEVYKWQNTYDLDDAVAIVVLKLINSMDKWNKNEQSFYYFANLRIKSALHEATRKYAKGIFEDIDEYAEILPDTNNIANYDGIFDYCQDILDDSEYEMIESIYKYGEYVKNSAEISSTSRKHRRILEKLRENLSEFDEF